MKKPYSELCEQEKQSIVQSFYLNKNLSLDEISDLLNLSRRSVRRVLLESGIESRRKNRYKFNESYFNKKNLTKTGAYLLGYIAADGFVGEGKFNNLVVHSNDLEIVEIFKKELEYDGKIKKSSVGGFKNSTFGYLINVSSKELIKDLNELGIYSKKSLTYSKLPDISEEVIPDFVRGYFDGDGSFISSVNSSISKKNGRQYSYTKGCFSIIGTEPILRAIVSALNIKRFNLSKSKTQGLFYLKVCSKGELKRLYDLMYYENCSCLKRKQNKWFNHLSALNQ